MTFAKKNITGKYWLSGSVRRRHGIPSLVKLVGHSLLSPFGTSYMSCFFAMRGKGQHDLTVLILNPVMSPLVMSPLQHWSAVSIEVVSLRCVNYKLKGNNLFKYSSTYIHFHSFIKIFPMYILLKSKTSVIIIANPLLIQE